MSKTTTETTFEIEYAKMLKSKMNCRGIMKENSPKYLREKARISNRKLALAEGRVK